MGEQCRHSIVADNVLGRDVARHLCLRADRARKRRKTAEEREFREKFTPWCKRHWSPPWISSSLDLLAKLAWMRCRRRGSRSLIAQHGVVQKRVEAVAKPDSGIQIG